MQGARQRRSKENYPTKEDFSELKGIVKELALKIGDLAEAQKRTELRVEELAEAQMRTDQRLNILTLRMEELAEAQKRTEQRVEELAEAQKRTEQRVEELAEAQKRTEIEVQKLAGSLKETRQELGGLARSMGYAFENEAYRFLPLLLKTKYGIEVKEKMIRTEIGGKEINLFCRATKNGNDIFVVGEAKLRTDEKREKGEVSIFAELEEKIAAVHEEYGNVEIARIIVTHYATKEFLKRAKERGIIVVQSFEW